MREEIKCYEFRVVYDELGNASIQPYEPIGVGRYCLAYHIDELEDEIFRLRSKYNDWERIE